MRIECIRPHPSNCALGVIVSPKKCGIQDVLELQDALSHRAGMMGAGFAVAWMSPEIAAEKARKAEVPLDPREQLHAATIWQYNSDVDSEHISARLSDHGVRLVFAEDIPTDPSFLNTIGLATRPLGLQRLFVRVDSPKAYDSDPVKRREKEFGHLAEAVRRLQTEDFTQKEILVPSFTPVYQSNLGGGIEIFKGVGTAREIAGFYKELQFIQSRLRMAHGRFPTLTSQWWGGAHPFQQGKWIGIHNGNIISYGIHLEALKEHYALLAGTDSEAIPAAVDYLTRVKNLPIELALLTLKAPSWLQRKNLSPVERDFITALNITFDDMLLDGPAGLILTNGEKVYALTGRQGVRPLYVARNKDNGLVAIASEVGPISVGAEPVSRGKIDSDQTVVVYVEGAEVKTKVVKDYDVVPKAARQYPDVFEGKLYAAVDYSDHAKDGADREPVKPKQAAKKVHDALVCFGCSPDTFRRLRAEAESGAVVIQSTGEKKPLAIFRGDPTPFLSFFQIGASEVGDPSIDPDRMNIETVIHLGRRADSLDEVPEVPYQQLLLKSPILFSTRYLPKKWDQAREVLSQAAKTFGTAMLGEDVGSGSVPVEMRSIITTKFSGDFEDSINKICQSTEAQINSGKSIIVLSDIVEGGPADVIPATLVIRLVDKYLKGKGIRHQASLVVESLEVVSSAAVFKTMALGADAVSIDPRFILAAFGIGEYDLGHDPLSSRGISLEEAQARAHNLFTSWTHQLKKLMGGADITDINNLAGNRMLVQSLGLGADLASILGVFDEQIGRRSLDFFVRHQVLPFGSLQFGKPPSLARHDSKEFADMLRDWIIGEATTAQLEAAREATDYLDLLELKKPPDTEINPDEVSLKTRLFPVDGLEREIELPFVMGGISLGAGQIGLHEILADVAAEQRTFYNTGEGGRPLTVIKDPDSAAIKRFLSEDEWTTIQVASGRWGLSMEVIRKAGCIEIKIAQGAKPGIGGHLPGRKVGEAVAVTRGVPEGSSVISPATHQDITSIEDLRALISLLREAAGDKTPIQVKLAALPGMEWIAIGAVRCGADALVIDGFRGSTGAAPWAQRNEVGLPIASAIALVDDALRREGIRDQVSLVAGGGLRTVKEFLIMIALGADAVMGATVMMEAMGCTQCEACHTGKCQAGITAGMGPGFEKFEDRLDVEVGKRNLNAWFGRVKQEMKAQLARMGLSSIDELRGRRDLLALMDSKDIVNVLDPAVIYWEGGDYSYLAAPLLKRQWVDRALAEYADKLSMAVSRTDGMQLGRVAEFDAVDAVDRLVQIFLTPGISSAGKRAVIEALEETAGNLEGVTLNSTLPADIREAAGSLREGKKDALRRAMASLYNASPLTSKLQANRICGCIGECHHKKLKEAAAHDMVLEFEVIVDKLGKDLQLFRQLDVPEDTDEERNRYFQRKRELEQQSFVIDMTGIPLEGEHYIGVSLVRVLDEFREDNPEWVGDIALRVSGMAGHDLAALATRGLTVEIVEAEDQMTGVQNGAGKMGQGGRIIVHGEAGDLAGYAMRAGRIYIKGGADDLIAANLRGVEGPAGPVVVVGGGVKNRACESMAGGMVIIVGDGLVDGESVVGQNFAPGVFGGTIFVHETADELEKHIDPDHLVNLDLEEMEAIGIQEFERQLQEARDEHSALLKRGIMEMRGGMMPDEIRRRLILVESGIRELENKTAFAKELGLWCRYFGKSYGDIALGTWTRVTAKTRNPLKAYTH